MFQQENLNDARALRKKLKCGQNFKKLDIVKFY